MTVLEASDFDRVMGVGRGSHDNIAYHQRAIVDGNIDQLLDDAIANSAHFEDYARACVDKYRPENWLQRALKLTGYNQSRIHRHRTRSGAMTISGVCNHTLVHADNGDGVIFHLVRAHRLGWNMDTGIKTVCGQAFTRANYKFEAALNGDFYKTKHDEWPKQQTTNQLPGSKYVVIFDETKRSICKECAVHEDEFPETKLQMSAPTLSSYKNVEYAHWKELALETALEMTDTASSPQEMVQNAWTKALAQDLANLFHGCSYESVVGLIAEDAERDISDAVKDWKANLVFASHEQWTSLFTESLTSIAANQNFGRVDMTDIVFDWVTDNLR